MEDQVFGEGEGEVEVEVEGHGRSHAIADEDLARENDAKTPAAHFVHVASSKAARDAVHAGATVKLGCDPTNQPSTPLTPFLSGE